MKFPKPVKRERKRKRPRRQRKGTPAALVREADRLWSLIVRSGERCEDWRIHVCSGPFQAAHGFSRRYRNTRWLAMNGFKLCASSHVYYTHRPLEWDDFLMDAWGREVYEELRGLALRTTPPDVAEALEKLRAEAAQRGIE